MIQTVTIGPVRVFFTNRNEAMALRGHSHYAEVSVSWRHDGLGWPSFGATNGAVEQRIRHTVMAGPITGTNEDVVALVWNALREWQPPEADKWEGCAYTLYRVELAVMGVPDNLDHAGGMTRYAMEAS